MSNQRLSFSSQRELQEAILQEKAQATPDVEIGHKYGVTLRYIERLITRTKGINVSALKASKKIKTLFPKDFKEEHTSVWSFKQRGTWATHSGEYRGNWSPYIPRNVILKYSRPGELVLDCFCGAGTTAVEAKLLGRRCVALDINDKAIELAKQNIDFPASLQQLNLYEETNPLPIYEPQLLVGDARDLSFLQDSSVDLICTHPPYANILHYTDSKEGDLSFFDIDEFLTEMSAVAEENFRVLRPGRQCAVLIGDTRRKKNVIPLGFKLIDVYLNAGFKLKELVIKRQHNCKTTGLWYANSIKYNFLLLAHEYLPVFEKPKMSSPLSVQERGVGYGLAVPTLEKPPPKRKLDEVETTTVWVLQEKDFEERLNRNVIDRYSKGDDYRTITFASLSENATYPDKMAGRKELGLLFIKLPLLNNGTSYSGIELYLQSLRETINCEMPQVKDGGFLVLQTQDMRMKDRYIEPVAKRVLDTLTEECLRLKEIIIVTKESLGAKAPTSSDNLEIAHQYLIVYEVGKNEN